MVYQLSGSICGPASCYAEDNVPLQTVQLEILLMPAVMFLEPDPLYLQHFVIPAYPRHLTVWLPGFMTQPAMLPLALVSVPL